MLYSVKALHSYGMALRNYVAAKCIKTRDPGTESPRKNMTLARLSVDEARIGGTTADGATVDETRTDGTAVGRARNGQRAGLGS